MFLTDPLEPLQIACDINELANFAVVDPADPVLALVAGMATAQAVEFLRSEILGRNRKVIYQNFPTFGTNVPRSLAGDSAVTSGVLALPYAALLSISEVKIFGEVSTDFSIMATSPSSIFMNNFGASDSELPAAEITYRAGYAETLAGVPSGVQHGVIALAAYLYEHRGSCSGIDALKNSGAFSMLYPHKLQAELF